MDLGLDDVTELVDEVGVDDVPLDLGVGEPGEPTHTAAHVLQHRECHVVPPLVARHRFQQLGLFTDRRDVGLGEQVGRDVMDLRAQLGEVLAAFQRGKLETIRHQVEPLGLLACLLVVRAELAGQSEQVVADRGVRVVVHPVPAPEVAEDLDLPAVRAHQEVV